MNQENVHNSNFQAKTILSLREMILAAFFAALTFIMGFISIPLPFSPVPITGQTFALMLTGSLLNPITAFFSMVVYLLLGAIGIPVFAGLHGGIGVLLGPTGGYLFAMPIAALIMSLLIRKIKLNYLKLILINIFGGILVVYAIGIPQLAYVAGIGLKKALLVGAVPYLIGDFIKVLIASYLALKLRPILNRYK
ncbi:biotin transport system substrate-specific component [Thermoanaerobacterium sp. RBIITD]|nr:biotin transporter BioY [Thermoanaerobacterium sp. RBIITD]SNX55071.1 biotin transport system substrate-specific component [Thermoanaerobacterium sp. RBIITD]